MSATDAIEKIGLSGLKGNQAAKHVKNVQQINCVLREQKSRLDVTQGRRGAPITDDRPCVIAAPRAEPLHENVFARDLVRPHLG
jgi:hypothetical protein